jgi:hypothetical protein
MNKKENGSRVGFHSIESILKYNPHKIKKVTFFILWGLFLIILSML